MLHRMAAEVEAGRASRGGRSGTWPLREGLARPLQNRTRRAQLGTGSLATLVLRSARGLSFGVQFHSEPAAHAWFSLGGDLAVRVSKTLWQLAPPRAESVDRPGAWALLRRGWAPA